MKTNNSRFCFGIAVYAALAALCAALILTACPTGGGGDGGDQIINEPDTLILDGLDGLNRAVQIILSSAAKAVYKSYTVTLDGDLVDSGTVSGITTFTCTSSTGDKFTIKTKTSGGKTSYTVTGSIPGTTGIIAISGGTTGAGAAPGASDPVGDLEGYWERADGVGLSFEQSSDGKKIELVTGYLPPGTYEPEVGIQSIYRTGNVLTMKSNEGHFNVGDSFKAVVTGDTLTISACTGIFQTGKKGNGTVIAPGGYAGTYVKQIDD